MNENKETEVLREYYSNHTKEEQAKAICERIVFLVKRSSKGWMRGFFALVAIQNGTHTQYVATLREIKMNEYTAETMLHKELDEWICEVGITEH